MGKSESKHEKDSTTSTSSIPGPITESKECDPGFIYIPLSLLNKTEVPREQADNRPGLKLIDGVPSFAEILNKSSHVILYDNQTRNAAWVFQILNEQTITEEPNQPLINHDWYVYYRSQEPCSETSYENSYLAEIHRSTVSRTAMNDTNLISLNLPQPQKCNIWKMLKEHCQRLIHKKRYQNLYVYTGPLYCPKSDKNKGTFIEGKAGPTHFFNVIIKEKTEGERELECFSVPNIKLNKKLKKFSTNLEFIEKLSGLVFSMNHQEEPKDSCFNFLNCSMKHSKECDPDFIYIPLSYLNPSVHQGEITNNRPGFKLMDGLPLFVEALKKSSHVILYDNRTRNAAWVFEILNDQIINGEAKRPSTYKTDKYIHEYYRAPESKHLNKVTGYNRGHLAAANNHKWSRKALDDTNLLSNISPQHEKLNSRTWVKLENHCRRFIENKVYQNVYVYTGPLYCPESDDEEEFKIKILGGKAVPTHFFKVIIKEKSEGKRELECYKMPNRELPAKEKLEKYRTHIDVIEKLSGLVFSENSQETESKRVTVQMIEEQKYQKITRNVQIIIPEREM